MRPAPRARAVLVLVLALLLAGPLAGCLRPGGVHETDAPAPGTASGSGVVDPEPPEDGSEPTPAEGANATNTSSPGSTEPASDSNDESSATPGAADSANGTGKASDDDEDDPRYPAAPRWHVGDWWRYRMTTGTGRVESLTEVVRVDDEHYAINYTVTRDGGLIRHEERLIARANLTRVDANNQVLFFPMYVGDARTFVRGDYTSRVSVEQEQTLELDGFDAPFDTLRLRQTIDRPGQGEVEFLHWFAPGARNAVMRSLADGSGLTRLVDSGTA